MDTRKSYFVSLDKETITEISIPDTAEYEIVVTQEELEQLRILMSRNGNENFWFAMRNLIFKPFAEGEVESMRETMDENLMSIYQFLFDYGTNETKEKLASAGLVDEVFRGFQHE